MGRVEDLEAGGVEGGGQDLGREARATHAREDDAGETGRPRGVGDLPRAGDPGVEILGDVQPAEPFGRLLLAGGVVAEHEHVTVDDAVGGAGVVELRERLTYGLVLQVRIWVGHG